MSIVITTPTGHIGAELTRRLLDAGQHVTLLARNPEKVAWAADRGATVKAGNLDDSDFLVEATKGAQTLFWLTPPNPAAPSFRAYQRQLGLNAARAVRKNGISRVVNLSSVGAHLGQSAGPVNGLYDVELALDAVTCNVTHLRPGAFYENTLWSLDTIKNAGAIFLPVDPNAKIPMIATADIAQAAAETVLDTSWSGKRQVHLAGPADLSYNEVAASISRALERPVNFVQVTPDAARQGMLAAGLPAGMVENYLELYAAFSSGLVNSGITDSNLKRYTTTFDTFARTVLRGAYGA